MNETIREQISAFVDGELPDGEAELLLRQLGADSGLKAEAEQFLKLGGALRGDAMQAMGSMRAAITAAVAAEPPQSSLVESPAVAMPGRFMRPVVGVAVAASVAVMALIGLRQLEPGGEVAPSMLRDLSAVAIDAGSLATEPPLNDFVSDRPSDRLTQYYLSHGQSSSNLGSRLVGLEVREDRLTEQPGDEDAETSSGEAAVAPVAEPRR